MTDIPPRLLRLVPFDEHHTTSHFSHSSPYHLLLLITSGHPSSSSPYDPSQDDHPHLGSLHLRRVCPPPSTTNEKSLLGVVSSSLGSYSLALSDISSTSLRLHSLLSITTGQILLPLPPIAIRHRASSRHLTRRYPHWDNQYTKKKKTLRISLHLPKSTSHHRRRPTRPSQPFSTNISNTT